MELRVDGVDGGACDVYVRIDFFQESDTNRILGLSDLRAVSYNKRARAVNR